MTTLRGLAVDGPQGRRSRQREHVLGARAAPGAGSTSASNGTSLNANIALPNTVVQQTLGRLPANGLPNGTTTINMLSPGQLYGQRVTQVDMSLAKVFKFGGRRPMSALTATTCSTRATRPVTSRRTIRHQWCNVSASERDCLAAVVRLNLTFNF